MDFEKLEADLKALAIRPLDATFIFDLLLAYGTPKATIGRLRKGDYNLSKVPGEVLWKKKLCFRVETDDQIDLHVLIDDLKNDVAIVKQHPRFVIVTDYKTLLAIDMKAADSLDIPITDLPRHANFFLPWAGMEKSAITSESPADVKAAEKMGRLYDLLLQRNQIEDDRSRHALNVFLSRLLFCFFAEDTGIFQEDQFTRSVDSHTAEDGSDLRTYLERLFKALNLKDKAKLPEYLKAFPYVNGGLFADSFPAPEFGRKSRKLLIDCGALNWKAINPDIFGSMMQAVTLGEERSSIGMHYTSVVNIKKLIEPLFLDDLRDALEKSEGNEKQLAQLLDRLYHLRVFDPACGSGNFLIISYKELCKLEIEIFQQLQELNPDKWRVARSGLLLRQFYGIEIDDFAVEITRLSLWLTEHQMNLSFREVFGQARSTLPLTETGNIFCGNATRLDWANICAKEEKAEIYILGNPPYQGSKKQSPQQKSDMAHVFRGSKTYKNLDYIACWFCLASEFIESGSSRFAFVATNSITQGDQIDLLWPRLFARNQEIVFAHTVFRWGNSAKRNAGVSCVIIGMAQIPNKVKWLFQDSRRILANNITPYLTNDKNILVKKRNVQISRLPEMVYGNMPLEGNFLKLDEIEKDSLLAASPKASLFVRPLIGGDEFLKGKKRWCIWIDDDQLAVARSIPLISKRIKGVEDFRREGGDVARTLVHKSHQFRYRHEAKKDLLIVPCTSSEKRDFLPCGFFSSDYITLNSAQVIYDPDVYIFSILSSRMHLAWVRAVAGGLETRIRYSAILCYNTFCFPAINNDKRKDLEDHAFRILEERERYSEMTIAELYDPARMPSSLRKAHTESDLAIEQCYRQRPFESDDQRLEHLFNLYEEMISAESAKGTN